MGKKFEFKYNFIAKDYRICFKNQIRKFDIEKPIKEYIIKNSITLNESYILTIDDNIEIRFNIICNNLDYLIEVNDILLVE